MSDFSKEKIGVVLLNMGGPKTLDDIESFLYELFIDQIKIPFMPLRKFVAKRIAKKRTPKVMPRYQTIGGGSPILEETEAQAKKLSQSLSEKEWPVFIAMRYTSPRASETINEMKKQGITIAVLLPLYPQYCSATSFSSLNEFENEGKKQGIKAISISNGYPALPGFIDPMADEIIELLDKLKNPVVLFSAHGVPEKMIKNGDPYAVDVEKTVHAIVEKLPKDTKYKLAFQSRLGPVKWLEPYLDETVIKLAKSGVKELIVVPISFVCEHIETLHELDIELKELAIENGIEQYHRISTVREDQRFIDDLAIMVTKTIEAG